MIDLYILWPIDQISLWPTKGDSARTQEVEAVGEEGGGQRARHEGQVHTHTHSIWLGGVCLQALLPLQGWSKDRACFLLFHPNFQHSSALCRQQPPPQREGKRHKKPHTLFREGLEGTEYQTKAVCNFSFFFPLWTITASKPGVWWRLWRASLSGRCAASDQSAASAVYICDSVRRRRTGQRTAHHGDGIRCHGGGKPEFKWVDALVTLCWIAVSLRSGSVQNISRLTSTALTPHEDVQHRMWFDATVCGGVL